MSLRAPSLVAALPLLVVACGGGTTSSSTDLAPLPSLSDDGGSTGIAVTFHVHVPDKTPQGDAVYLAGNFQGWDPAAPADRLAAVDALTHQITLRFAHGDKLEFKFTRGSWASVEKDKYGAEIPNRSFEVLADTTLDLTVASWSDLGTSTVVGDVTVTTVPGFLGGRSVRVYLPPGYHSSTDRYPVLYMLDGQNVFDATTSFAGEWKVDETLEQLIPAKQVAPLIVVAVDNGPQRISEYTPWPDAGQAQGGGGAAHLAAITDVLLPWVNATYRTQTGPTHTGFCGSSLGGLMALYATYARPDLFGRIAAVSPSIWWDSRHIVTWAASRKRPTSRLYMDMGTAEDTDAIADLEAMRDALVKQGFTLGTDLKVVEDPGAGHNEAAWSRRLPDAVKFLFPP